jgi:hypothetical protein
MGADQPASAQSQSFQRIQDNNVELEDKMRQTEILEKQLKGLQKALELTVKQRLDLATGNYGFGESVEALANVETDETLAENLRVLSNIHKKLKGLHEKQVRTLFTRDCTDIS